MSKKRLMRVIPLLLAICLMATISGSASPNTRSSRSVYIFYDSTTPGGIVANMNTIFNYSTNAFNTKFGLSFSANSVSSYSSLNGGNCPLSNSQLCNYSASGCGAICTGSHHKNIDRLLAALPNLGSTHSLGVVGHALCFVTSSLSHDQAGGVAYLPPARRAVVSSVWPEPIEFLIQHELSHNLGTLDHGGSDRCVMRYDDLFFNEWCSTCIAAIQSNI
ncbi:MAG: hypothetical protein FWH17_08395 [Oscillospiraceae bacterium]|nr:hypothetical protein [Oscillospiraceae bacterium]